jgi:ketosteroid isomerase-like protein
MPESDLDLVRELMERFNGYDREAVLELLSEDFVAEVPPSLSAEPDVYEGHDGARRYLQGFDGMLEDVRFEVLELHQEGEQVISELELTGRGVTSGIEVAQRVAVINWVEAGKVTRMQPFPDLAAARDALQRVE